MTIGLGGPSTTRDLLPPEGQGMGRLYRLGEGNPQAVADFHAFEVANNPDAAEPGSDVESNPNSVDATGGKPIVVADAGGNDILAVRHGAISVVALLPFGTAPAPAMPGAPPPPAGTTIPVDPVPTSVVRAPDGSLYVGQLTGFPFVPGAAASPCGHQRLHERGRDEQHHRGHEQQRHDELDLRRRARGLLAQPRACSPRASAARPSSAGASGAP